MYNVFHTYLIADFFNDETFLRDFDVDSGIKNDMGTLFLIFST